MSFNAELFREAWKNVFSHSRGSCTWIEHFILHDITAKMIGAGRIKVVNQNVLVNGEKYPVSAYQIDVGETNTFLITASANHELAGTICHFYNGFTQASVLRYFYGEVYFAEMSGPVKRLTEQGYSAPIQPGVAAVALVDMLCKLDIPIGKEEFLENVDGMAQWVQTNYPKYANAPWPIAG